MFNISYISCDINTELTKKESFVMLEASQCRAARALLNWTQTDLAEKTSISAVSIRAFEKGGEMRASNLKLIRLSFEAAGLVFLDSGALLDGGPGVRLPKAQAGGRSDD